MQQYVVEALEGQERRLLLAVDLLTRAPSVIKCDQV